MRFLAIAIAIGPSKRWGRAMREALQAYVKCGVELAEHVRGNEQATKQSLIGPLSTILGDDLARTTRPELDRGQASRRRVDRDDPG